MANNVEEIKARLNIEDVVSQYVKLTPAGANFKARCPFHNEKTPSFMVSPSRQTYHCFGCGCGGDMFTFIQEIEGLDFKGALKLLADKAGVTLTYEPGQQSEDKDALFTILEEATHFYEQELKKNKKAIEYLESRGLSKEAIKSFRLGFVPDVWDATYQHLKGKKFEDAPIEKAGLTKKGNKGYYDRLRSRIIFPIADSAGRVVAFTGRIFGKEDDKTGKYINSPETALYHKSRVLYGYDRAKQPIRRTDFAILVEGQMDVIAAHQAGYTNTVALSGTALSDEQVTLLSRMSKNLVIALDADRAGIASASKSSRAALRAGFDVKIAKLPHEKDPADILKEEGAEAWKKIIKESKHVIEFFLDFHEQETKDTRTFKLKATKEVLPFLHDIQSAVDKAHFVSRVANRLGVSEEVITQELSGIPSTSAAPSTATAQKKDAHAVQQHPEEQLHALYVWQSQVKRPLIDVSELKKRLQEALGGEEVALLEEKGVDEGILFRLETLYSEPDSLAGAIDEFFSRIEERKIREKLKEATGQLKKAQEKGDSEGEQKALALCNELREKLATLE